MEVFVRNLPDQTTEKQAKQIFKPILAQLDVHVFHCHKSRGKSFAKITIGEADKQKGQRFLDLHGQVKPGAEGFRRVKCKIYHMGKPINCSQSRSAPDEFVLRSLERDEAEKKAAKSRYQSKSSTRGSKRLQRVYNFSFVQCGYLDYSGRDLGFVVQNQDSTMGSLTFGRRFAVVNLKSSTPHLPDRQMEITYQSVDSITLSQFKKPYTNEDSYITFTLAEAPKFFEKDVEKMILVNDLTSLGLQPLQGRQNAPTRHRTTALDPHHQAAVSTCLCYRFHIQPADVQSILAMKGRAGYPDIVSWDIPLMAQTPLPIQMTQLNTILSTATDTILPFETKFQLQKLVQNGYLPPYKVNTLAVIVKHTMPEAERSTLAAAVRRLIFQIPFAGPGIEALELGQTTLRNLVTENYDTILHENAYSKGIDRQHEQIAMIHKATVTPAGVYLFGPEPEVKNRVLRKYSAFSSYFLQVTFADEDGEPIRYDRTCSLSDIYHKRFKKVLGSSITIAGRPYEVTLALELAWKT